MVHSMIHSDENLEFKITNKELKDGSKAWMIVDSYGYLCGIYDSAETALVALPIVKNNIYANKVPKRVLNQIPKHAKPECISYRQLSRKK